MGIGGKLRCSQTGPCVVPKQNDMSFPDRTMCRSPTGRCGVSKQDRLSLPSKTTCHSHKETQEKSTSHFFANSFDRPRICANRNQIRTNPGKWQVDFFRVFADIFPNSKTSNGLKIARMARFFDGINHVDVIYHFEHVFEPLSSPSSLSLSSSSSSS